MAQIKKSVSVTNGSQTVTIAGVDLTSRIKKNSIFLVEGELVPYTVSLDSVYAGSNTVVTLSGVYQGATALAAAGVFAVDFTYPDMIPTIAQGDVGTAAVFTAAMYRVQNMVTSVSPEGMSAYAGYYTDVQNWHTDVINARLSAQNWASQATGVVDGTTNYSSKYYAGQSSASATLAQNFAVSLNNTFTGSGGVYGALKYANDASLSATLASKWATSTTTFAGSNGAFGAIKYANDASSAAALAQAWASQATGTVGGTTQYSAAYWAQKAADSASSAATGGQVNSDWNAINGVGQIFNKPVLAPVATSGAYADLTGKPVVPAAYTLPTASTTVLGGVKIGSGLTIDGQGAISASVGGSGTVTSVAVTAGSNKLSVTGSPVTTAGTININVNEGNLSLTNMIGYNTLALLASPSFSGTPSVGANAIVHAGNVGTYAISTAGGTINGNLTLTGAAPGFHLFENDQVSVPGRWRFVADGGQFRLDRSTDMAANGFSTFFTDFKVGTTGIVTIPQLNVTTAVAGDNSAALNFRATGASSTHASGAWLEWNKNAGDGATWLLNQKGGGNGGIIFGEVSTANVITERARISASGNLLIGTSTDDGSSTKLQIAGGMRADSDITTGTAVRALAEVCGTAGADGEVKIGGDPAGGIEVGRIGRTTAGTPFIDFHSSTGGSDYDSRIIATGGNSTPGQGSLNVMAVDLQINGTGILGALNGKQATSAKDASGGYAGLTGFALNLLSAAGAVKSALTSLAAAARTYTFPDRDITVAGTTNETFINPTFIGYIEKLQALNPGATVTLNTANGTLIEITTTANITITLPPSVPGVSYTVIVIYGGAHTVTITGGTTLNWQGGSTPGATSVAGKKDKYLFTCGTGYTLGQDSGRNF